MMTRDCCLALLLLPLSLPLLLPLLLLLLLLKVCQKVLVTDLQCAGIQHSLLCTCAATVLQD